MMEWKFNNRNSEPAKHLKLDSHLPKKSIYFNESPLKMMRNAFYFNLEALFVLKMCGLFGFVENTV